MRRLISRTDFWAGIVLLSVALFFLWFGRHLAVGQLTRLGPGFVPLVSAVFVGMFGLAAIGLAISDEADVLDRLRPHRIAPILLAIAVFGFCVERFGLVISAIVLVLISSLSARDAKPLPMISFALVLSLAAAALFIWAFEIPIRAWPW